MQQDPLQIAVVGFTKTEQNLFRTWVARNDSVSCHYLSDLRYLPKLSFIPQIIVVKAGWMASMGRLAKVLAKREGVSNLLLLVSEKAITIPANMPVLARSLKMGELFDELTRQIQYHKRQSLAEIPEKSSPFIPSEVNFSRFYNQSVPADQLMTLLTRSSTCFYTASLHDPFKLTFVSENSVRFLGYTSLELTTNPDLYHSRIHKKDRVVFEEEFKKLSAENGDNRTVEYRLMNIVGAYRWIRDERTVTGEGDVVGHWSDITEEKELHEEWRTSKERMRAIVDNSQQSFILLDIEMNVIAFNRLALHHAKWISQNDLHIGINMEKYVPDYAYHMFVPKIKAAMRGVIVHYEREMPHPSGESIWFDIMISPVYHDSSTVSGVIINAMDITERKEAAMALEKSEQRLRSLVQNSSDIITVLNEEGVVIYETPVVEQILGFSVEERIGTQSMELVTPEDRIRMVEAFERTRRNSGHQESLEYRCKTKDGDWVILDSVIYNRLDDEEINGLVVTTRDITQRRKDEEQLRLLATAIGAAEEAVLITDAKFGEEGPKIVFVNQGFCAMSGYDPDDILGKTPSILEGSNTDQTVIKDLYDALKEGKKFNTETISYRKDGSEYVVDWQISPVFDPEGTITHFVSLQRDVTERKKSESALEDTAKVLADRNRQLELARRDAEKSRTAMEKAAEELRRAYEQAAKARKIAEEANEAKSQFLANMSHEIRTPMTAIIGFGKLFKERKLDGETREFVDQIVSSGEHLLTLINDILDLSKIESGKLQIEESTFSPRELVYEIGDLYTPLAEKKKVELRVKDFRVPHQVIQDRKRLRQVVTNLVGNAIKFTERGWVELSITGEERPKRLVITVEDTGAGIAQADQKNVFEPFYQAENSAGKKHEGTGLGLAITTHIVEAMKGSIDLWSQESVGTKFVVTVPCEFVEVEAPSEQKLATDRAIQFDTGDLRILVADDHKPNRMLIEHTLKAIGHEVVLAEDGLEAVERFQQEAFDIILMDVQMPRMDGYEAIQKIRAMPGGDRIPILTLTAYAMQGDRETALDHGADDYLSKPFDPNQLVEKVAMLSHQQKVSFDKKWEDPALKQLRLEYLESVVNACDEYKKELPGSDDLAMWSHRIAGSGGSFGYPEITKIGRTIEKESKDGIEEQQLQLYIRELEELSRGELNKLTRA